MGSPAENKALVRRFYEEIDRGCIDIIDELVAEDYIDHSPAPFPNLPKGREGVKQASRMFQRATPGTHHIDDQIAEGDKVVTRLTSTGRHEGDLPTDSTISILRAAVNGSDATPIQVASNQPPRASLPSNRSV